jgi:hypothetical protein
VSLSRIRVLLADDHPVVAEGVRARLEKSLNITARLRQDLPKRIPTKSWHRPKLALTLHWHLAVTAKIYAHSYSDKHKKAIVDLAMALFRRGQ